MSTVNILEGVKPKDLPAIPVGYRVLVKQLKNKNIENNEVKSEHGIIIATGDEAYREQVSMDIGLVVAMGSEVFSKNTTRWYEVGDHIKFIAHNGYQIKHNDDIYHLMNDEDPLAKVPEEVI